MFNKQKCDTNERQGLKTAEAKEYYKNMLNDKSRLDWFCRDFDKDLKFRAYLKQFIPDLETRLSIEELDILEELIYKRVLEDLREKAQKQGSVFLEKTEILSRLYMKEIFVETTYPILFSCIDDFANTYICSCHFRNAGKCEWIIALSNEQELLALQHNNLTIREAFTKNNESVFVVSLLPDGTTVIKENPLTEVEDILPTAGYFLDIDED